MVSKKELVQDTIQVHGYAEAAKLYRKKVPFSLFYWLAFGRAPRILTAPPVTSAEYAARKALRSSAKSHIGRLGAPVL